VKNLVLSPRRGIDCDKGPSKYHCPWIPERESGGNLSRNHSIIRYFAVIDRSGGREPNIHCHRWLAHCHILISRVSFSSSLVKL
jgi:hypothetical protein